MTYISNNGIITTIKIMKTLPILQSFLTLSLILTSAAHHAPGNHQSAFFTLSSSHFLEMHNTLKTSSFTQYNVWGYRTQVYSFLLLSSFLSGRYSTVCLPFGWLLVWGYHTCRCCELTYIISFVLGKYLGVNGWLVW